MRDKAIVSASYVERTIIKIFKSLRVYESKSVLLLAADYYAIIRLSRKKGSVIMATISITRNITISKEDFEKIQSSEPTPLLKEVYATVEAKRSKVKLPENWIEKYVKK